MEAERRQPGFTGQAEAVFELADEVEALAVEGVVEGDAAAQAFGHAAGAVDGREAAAPEREGAEEEAAAVRPPH